MTDKVLMYCLIALGLLYGALAVGWGLDATYTRAVIAKQAGKIAEHEGTILKLSTELTNAVEANKKLVASVDVQNQRIVNFERAAEKASADAKAAIAKAKADGAEWRRRYEKILVAPPSNPDDLCGSLNIRLDNYIDLRREP